MEKFSRLVSLVVITIIVACCPHAGYCTPQVANVTFTNISSSRLSAVITGNGFGIKSSQTPLYWNNFENDSVGFLPSGIKNSNTTNGGFVTGDFARGNKSVLFDYDTTSTEQWSRDFFDLGSDGVDNLYISAWMYYDKTGTTSTKWQLKSFVFGSNLSTQGYFSSKAAQTTAGLEVWWDELRQIWFNNFGYVYYNGLTMGGNAGTLASDAFPFGQWHRIEIYAQRSSAPSTPNGKFYAARIGKSTPLANLTNAITHANNDYKWRIVGFGQGVASNLGGGRLKLNLYYDDLYIDNTQARVEFCNTGTWSARTHCEIQPTTSWADGRITITPNLGSFANGQVLYVYVVDPNGVVSNGSKSGYFDVNNKLTPSPTDPPKR